MRMLESEPTPKRPPCGKIMDAVEDAVTETGFGDRAETRHGAGFREAFACLRRGHLGAVDQAPVLA